MINNNIDLPEIKNDLKEFLISKKILIDFRTENSALWQSIFNNLQYQSVSYTNYSVEYQLEFQNSNIGTAHDLSFILFWDNKPVALVPLSLTLGSDNQLRLNSQGRPILPPIFIKDVKLKSIKKINSAYLQVLEFLLTKLGISKYESISFFINNFSLLNWHIQNLKFGSNVIFTNDLYIDLSSELSQIKNKFRTSYKSLVTSGLKYFQIFVLEKFDQKLWEEFRELHLNEAGRVTRNNKTWDIQLNSIKNSESFFVFIRDEDNEMVGGALIDYTKDEGYYSIAAYKRSLFDKPLGHIIQFKAIEILKEKGVKWYYLGPRYFQQDYNSPSDKQIAIADFKEGFSTDIIPRFIYNKEIL